MLIRHARQSAEDIAAWQRIEDQANVHAQAKRFRNQIIRSRAVLLPFVASGCYAGVSWGKDSVVMADLLYGVARDVPLVWIRVEPIKNPDCLLVRDAFLNAHSGCRYEEIEVQCEADPKHGEWHATGTLERGFAIAARKFGARHVSGIRADESGTRTMRMRRHGETTANTCAPIGWWSAWDVFAYLTTRYLPVHPAYACTLGGLLEPGRIRVASLGGQRGSGHGRAEWEDRYYRDELAALVTRARETVQSRGCEKST